MTNTSGLAHYKLVGHRESPQLQGRVFGSDKQSQSDLSIRHESWRQQNIESGDMVRKRGRKV